MLGQVNPVRGSDRLLLLVGGKRLANTVEGFQKPPTLQFMHGLSVHIVKIAFVKQ